MGVEEYAKFNFPIQDKSEKIIKVIGVGGGGGNAVQHMYEEGVKNVTFFVTNTDSQVLSANKVPNKLLLGEGLGAGGKREEGRKIAEESIEEIKKLFEGETQMVFITAGLGGGTGTGATPVIARTAKEMGILTIGVVTLPFRMEGKKRIMQALEGLEEIKKHVDSLIVINNEKLITDDQYNSLTLEDGLKKADEVLLTATKTIAEIITVTGKVNRDFNDVKSVMEEGGAAIVSMGSATGEKRTLKALSNAISSSLVANVNRSKVKRLLYIIYNGTKSPARINELQEINDFMEGFSDDILVLWGLYPDDTLEDEIKVAIVATGFDEDEPLQATGNKDEGTDARAKLYGKYYGIPSVSMPDVFDNDTKEDEENVEPSPTSTPDLPDHNDKETEHACRLQLMLGYLRKKIETLGQYVEE